ncbi:MAG: peptide-methionine (S)-S-oxide reductase MsrA [Spirochaetes bacterium]|nr:peptide-methionine (S)-S-oxide reductase MsrA [Spirochaetota bacterium]
MDAEHNYVKATLAGGCFWCMESPFTKLVGVHKVIPGYTGGTVKDPTYEQVCTGTTGHFEAVEITYDPRVISYRKILDVFWRQINPSDLNGQFADIGPQYRTAIFYHSEEQRITAEESKGELEQSGRFKAPVATLILKASKFYPAEEYHHGFYRKNPMRYTMYRKGSGREGFLRMKWGVEE